MANVGSPSPGQYPQNGCNVGYVKRVYVRWTSGASGAVATLLAFNEVASVTHTGTGAYTIQFTQAYNQSRNLIANVTQASYSSSGACKVRKVADASEAANGTLKIVTLTEAGAAVEPTTGDVIELTYEVATATGYP